MAFMKNINDLGGLFILLVLTIPTIAANIDCNGKPFHCLNSTHFMICVDVGSGVSSTLDDFVIPCPPTTVCKGTNRFECEFPRVTTTTTTAPSVAPLATTLSEMTTPLYDVTTSIPFEEYYNTLSTTTLSEYDMLAEQAHVTESIVQPAIDVAKNIDVFIPSSELNSNVSDIIHATDVDVQNNLLLNNISDVSNSISDATENVNTVASKLETDLALTTATNIVENSYRSTNSFTSNSMIKHVLVNATKSIFLETTETTPNVTSFTKAIQSEDFVNVDKTTESILVEATETTPNEITSSVAIVQDDMTTPTTSLFINIGVDASDLTTSARVNSGAAITNPQTKDVSLSPSSRATDIVENNFTLPDAFSNTALPINADTTSEPHTRTIPGTAEIVNMITNISLANNVDSIADNVTEPILLNVTKPLSTLIETISSGNDFHIDTNSESISIKVTEKTPNTLSKTTPPADVVENNPKILIQNATENAKVSEPETNYTFSETTSATEIAQNELKSPTNVLNSTTLHYGDVMTADDIRTDSYAETTEIYNVITPESAKISSLTSTHITQSENDSLNNLFSTSLPDNITDTVTQSTLVEVSKPTSSVLTLSETNLIKDFEKNDFTKLASSNNNNLKPILIEVTETTPSTLNGNLSGNNLNGESVKNYNVTEKNKKYPNDIVPNDLIRTSLPNAVTDTITESILIDVTQETPSVSIDSVKSNISRNTTLLDKINDNVTELTDIIVTQYENVNINESNLDIGAIALETPSNVTLLISHIITRPAVANVTENTSPGPTESKRTMNETILTNNLQYIATPLTLTGSPSLNNTDSSVTSPMITDITENPIILHKEYHTNQTLSGRLSGKSVNSTQLYIQSTVTLQKEMEPTVISNNMSINTLVNDSSKSNKTMEQDVANGIRKTEVPVEISNADLVNLTVTDHNAIHFENNLNSIIEETVFAQEVDSATYSNEYNHTNTENVPNYEGIFTNQAGDNNALSEKVLSTGTAESIASTPMAAMDNNYFKNYVVSTTHAAVTTNQAGLSTRSNTDTLIMGTEPLPSINNQKLHIQESPILGNESKIKALPGNTLQNIGTLPIVNDSSDDVPVRATSPSTEISIKPAYFIEALSTVPSTYAILAKQVSNDDILTNTDKTQVLSTEITTLGTTLSITETVSKVVISETTSDVPGSDLAIESEVSNAILPSLVNASDIPSISPITPNSLISATEALHTIVETNSKKNNQGLPTVLTVTENYATPDIKNDDHTTSQSAINIETTPLNSKTVNLKSSLLFYPTTEVIVTEVAKDAKPLLHATNKSEFSNITKILPSLLENYVQSKITSIPDNIPEKTTTVPAIDDSDFNINLQNSVQQENLKTNPPDLFTSLYKTELPAIKFIEMEAEIKKPERYSGLPENKTLFTNIIEKNITVTTESYYPVNKMTVTDTSHPNVLTESAPKAITEHNPLIDLLLGSLAEQTPNKTPRTETIYLESIPIPPGTATGDSIKSTTDRKTFVDATLPEPYTQSIVNNMNATYFQPKESNETLAYATVHAIGYTDQKKNDSTLAKNIPDTFKYIGVSQTIQVEGLEKSVQSSVNIMEGSSLHNRYIITDKQIDPYLGELHNTGIRITKPRETHSSTAIYNSANTLEPKMTAKPTSPSSVVDINTQLTRDNAITEGISININVQSKTENENTITDKKDILLNPVTDAVVSMPNIDAKAVEMPASLGISFLKDVTNIPAVILNQASVTPDLRRIFLNTPTIKPITESWRTKEVTKPYKQITSSLIATQSMTHTKEPNAESFTVTDDNTAPIASRLDSVLLNPVTHNNVPQYVMRLSNLDEKLAIAAKPTSVVFLTTETSNKAPQTSEKNVTTKPILDNVASNLGIKNNINVSNKINVIERTSSRTEFISSLDSLLDQTTEPLEQVITQDVLHLNLDKGIVMIDAVRTEVPVLIVGNVVSGTHSGISVLPKPPRKSKVESEKTEGSESVEKPERKNEQENEEKPEAPESNGVHNTTPVIVTTIANPKESEPETSISTDDNENIEQTSTTITVGFKSSTTNNEIKLKSTIEMPTPKLQHSEQNNQTITNMLSSAMKSPTEGFATQTEGSAISSKKEKSVENGTIVSTHFFNNVRSNIENSTTHYTPTKKIPFVDTHNASLPVPTVKSAANSRNFVCKLNRRGRFSDSKDCRKFYICIGKAEPIEGFCPNNTVFSELRKQCTKNLSHCVRNNQFQCVREGRFSDYLNDNIYYICVKNNVGTFIRFKLQCQSGYYLNKTSVRCALNTESNQSTSQQSTSDISKNNSDQSTSAKREKLVSKSNDKFECKKEGKFPDANNCRKYYVCTKKGKSQYRQKNKKCDSDELFHKDKKKCVDADSNECN